METKILRLEEGGLDEAVKLLRAGEVVGFPTETVYGLGGDARSDAAVKRIYEAKGRPSGNPVIVHVAGIDAARQCAREWTAKAEKLATHFWPGPLTMVLKRGASISPLVSAGRDTVALRCPRHPVAEELLRKFAGPVGAPSANRSGFTSPTTAAHVLAELAGRIPLILDGGPCDTGLESTIIDISENNTPTILRPGAVTAEMLREVLGEIQSLTQTLPETESAPSPGLHSRHYAPRHPAYRFNREQWPQAKTWAQTHSPVALLTHADDIRLPSPHETLRLPDAPSDYARTFYAALREADSRPVHAILVLEPATTAGLWTAIHDRLRRATLPINF